MARAYAAREAVFAGVMEDRRAWEQATAESRRLAVAADAELRRRHPGEQFPPLRSAEPEPVTDAESSELHLAAGEPAPEISGWIKDLAAGRSAFAGQLAERQSSALALQDPDYGDAGLVFPSWAGLGGEALLRPPKPEIRPSARVLNRAGLRQAEMEAAT